MTLSMIAKISAAYLGLAVSVGTVSALWDTGQELAAGSGLFNGVQLADLSRPG